MVKKNNIEDLFENFKYSFLFFLHFFSFSRINSLKTNTYLQKRIYLTMELILIKSNKLTEIEKELQKKQ